MATRDEIIKILKEQPSNLADKIAETTADQILKLLGAASKGEVNIGGSYLTAITGIITGQPIAVNFPTYFTPSSSIDHLAHKGEIDIPATMLIKGGSLEKEVQFNLTFQNFVLDSIFLNQTAAPKVINLEASLNQNKM